MKTRVPLLALTGLLLLVAIVLAGSAVPAVQALPTVFINEIHYDPSDPQSLSEFVELHNAGDTAAASPSAETLAINSRRVILPSVNILSNFFNSDMIRPPFV